MSESSPIKDALYAKIVDIGQDQIHQLLLNGKFSELFEKIYGSVIESVQNIEEYEKHGTLAESLTHYLFTEMLIPSQRKITFKNIELDMIIPNTEELQKNSHNTIMIFFVKTSNIEEIKQRIQDTPSFHYDGEGHIEIGDESIFCAFTGRYGVFDAWDFFELLSQDNEYEYKSALLESVITGYGYEAGAREASQIYKPSGYPDVTMIDVSDDLDWDDDEYYSYESTERNEIEIRTKERKLFCQRIDGNIISIDMGKPKFDWKEIPLKENPITDSIKYEIDGLTLNQPYFVNIGNPHVIFFVEDITLYGIDRFGPLIENDELFPEKVNVSIAEIDSESSISINVWERGAGKTLACGTAACAVAAAAVKYKNFNNQVEIKLPGGKLEISYKPDSNIIMSGKTELSFEGHFEF